MTIFVLNAHMRKPICFNLLISSPMDVREERDIVESVCREWNTTMGQQKNVIIETKRWEDDLKLDSRKKAQNLINQQLIPECDILFVIFGKRIGTPTEHYDSGTMEELEQIISAGKPFFIYFMQKSYTLDELDTQQIEKVKNLKKRFEQVGSFKDIPDHESLRKSFFKDVTLHIDQLQELVENPKNESSAGNEKKLV